MFVAVFDWLYAAPAVKTEAVIKVQISLFIAASMGMLRTNSTTHAAPEDCARVRLTQIDQGRSSLWRSSHTLRIDKSEASRAE